MRCSHSPSPIGTNGTDVRWSLPWALEVWSSNLHAPTTLLNELANSRIIALVPLYRHLDAGVPE